MIVSIQIVKFVDVLLLLWIVDRKYLHEEVSWVGELRDWLVDHFEILNGLLGISLVHNGSISHKNQSVEVEEGF